MTYNPEKDMPTTLQEWNTLIDHFTNKSATEHASAVAAAKAQAEATFDAGRDALREKMIAELEANLAAERIETPDGPVPLSEADYKKLWSAGISAIDAQLAKAREEAIQQAAMNVEPLKDKEHWKQLYMSAGYYPQPEPEQPAPTFAELKAQKKAELDAAFHTACQHPVVMTADGWPADANETANRNVQGLITTMEATGSATVQFCDAENSFHEVSLEQLRAIQLAIIEKGQALYAQKWSFRTAIDAAEDEAALAEIQIAFA